MSSKVLRIDIKSLNKAESLEHKLKNTFTMDYYRSAYVRDDSKSRIRSDYYSMKTDTSDKGLSEDKGIVRYYPEKSIYPNFRSELDSIYGFNNIGIKDGVCTNNQDFYTKLDVQSTRPITEVGNYINNYTEPTEKTNKINKSNLPKYIKNGYSRNINILPESSLNFNVGVISGVVYTTTTSILMESINPDFKGSGVEIPCSGIIADMLTDILLKTFLDYDMFGRHKGKLQKWVDSATEFNGRGRSSKAINDGFERIYDMIKERHDIHFSSYSANLLDFETFNVLKKEVQISIAEYRGRHIERIEDIKKNDYLYDNFLPLGTIIPLFRFYKDLNNDICIGKLNDMGSDIIKVLKSEYKDCLLSKVVKINEDYFLDNIESVGLYSKIEEDDYLKAKVDVINSINILLGNEGIK